MLLNLHIKNIALIDEVDIDFSKGFNVLTGETGAGKSILIDSVNFALGERMPKDVVRDDAEYALSELVFQVDDEETERALSNLDIALDDGKVILSRKIAKGKSSIKCNGETITAAMAKNIASYLIDIHGQHEHQSLLKKENHLTILDKYCGGDFSHKLDEYKEKYREYKQALRALKEAQSDNDKSSDPDYLEYVFNEIDNANLVIGEDVLLEDKFQKMRNAKKISENLMLIRGCLDDDEAGAALNISRAVMSMKNVASLDDSSKDLYSQLIDIEGLIQDFKRNLSDYEDDLTFSEMEYAECESRLNEINRLKNKYAPSIEGILAYRDDVARQLEMLSNKEEYLQQLLDRKNELYGEVIDFARALSEIRRSEAVLLAENIKESLLQLNFLDASFEISIESSEDRLADRGFDEAMFMISTNPGERVRPLTLVASGGELSRIMLALKAVFADRDTIESLIFDEIDTGISGRTAQAVADKISYIADSHQVICVTHLPQIASHGTSHFLIEKGVTDGRTQTRVSCLDYEESVAELARMLSGAEITEATLANAREMKDAALTK